MPGPRRPIACFDCGGLFACPGLFGCMNAMHGKREPIAPPAVVAEAVCECKGRGGKCLVAKTVCQ